MQHCPTDIPATTYRLPETSIPGYMAQSTSVSEVAELPELVQAIMQYFANDRETLCILSLMSKNFRLEAQRILFRKVTTLQDADDHTIFLATIVRSQRLALHVVAYAQENVADPGTDLWDLLCYGLQEMKNLKHLRFRARGGVASAHILRGCSFQLESLYWGCNSDEKELARNVLPLQPNMKQLRVKWNEQKKVSPLRSTCPGLVSLAGDRGVIEAFLPGRKITTLTWIPDLDDSTTKIAHLSDQLNRLRFLSFGGYFERPKLDLIVDHLQALEVLELLGSDATELQFLERIPNLLILILSPLLNQKNGPAPSKITAELIKEIFQACQCLQYIDVADDAKYYRRWVSFSSEPLPRRLSYPMVHRWWRFRGNL
ncbi:hypothetical protein BDZ97DRAFT_353223 [Flammula alnicola]|nr:hypothetical protein BDZ97DRAFT_353223 [Flammula alnicola]